MRGSCGLTHELWTVYIKEEKEKKNKRERHVPQKGERVRLWMNGWGGKKWSFSSCEYSKHSVHRERVTYWTGCLSLCFSLSLKQLCSTTLYSRDSPLSLCFSCLVASSFFYLDLSCCQLLFFAGSWFILSLCWSPFTWIWVSYPPTSSSSLPPSLSVSLALFPCFSLSLSLSLCEEGKRHQRPSHSNRACNRVQTAPSALPPRLSSSPPDSHPSQRKAAGKKRREQECSRAGEDLLPHRFLSRDQKRTKVKETGQKESKEIENQAVQ